LTKASGKTVNATRGRRKPSSSGVRSGNAVFLVGFMGAGKSSVGRALGQRLNWIFEDLDDRIEAREGRSVVEIFRDSGESEFRAGGASIVALGGGTFVQKENALLLSASGLPTVFLDAPVEELWQRCCRQASERGTERPLLRSLEEFRKLYEARRRNYSRASVQIQTGSRTVETIVSEIAATLCLNKIAVLTEEGEVE
jgi:shikimate kinase